jgi:hypothetical protein
VRWYGLDSFGSGLGLIVGSCEHVNGLSIAKKKKPPGKKIPDFLNVRDNVILDTVHCLGSAIHKWLRLCLSNEHN